MAILLPPSKWPVRHPSRRRRVTPVAAAASGVRKEDIVIVGAGISRLATAVALQRFLTTTFTSHLIRKWFKKFVLKRVGIESVVVEQAASLRSGGTSLTFFKNGWKVFDAIGVAAVLRPQFLEIEECVQEVHAVERGTLLEALVNRLPPAAISFSSKLKSIETGHNDDTLLTFNDDSVISAKVVFI
ncbi:hypothetical protein SASPL_126927 [Salvia splendens]|uniref:Uncharacterized protein n=1 Tax=Salvia splendens TaxID=180675 RepID=A0A8X8ZS64_SALSN|nr:hypothetical protein SASPL_126927 [Salvia splendens]